MKNLSRRTLLSVVTAALLLTIFSSVILGAAVLDPVAGAVAPTGQAYLGPPPEFPEAPVHSSASAAGVVTAVYLPIVRTEAIPSPWLNT